jgi:hypothetical protein
MPAATWTATAEPISPSDAVRLGYLDLDQLVDRTGLAAATIRDALSRSPIEDSTVPLGALARPAARIGGVASPAPMWSPEQVADFARRREARLRAGQTATVLPEVTATEARERGLASIEALAEELGLAPNSLRRWSRTFRTDSGGRAAFPPEVALAAREEPNHRGRQHRLRDRLAVIRWVRDHVNPVTDPAPDDQRLINA